MTLNRADAYLQEGSFDVDGMITLLWTEMEQVLAEGYFVLPVIGEITWALRRVPGSGGLIE